MSSVDELADADGGMEITAAERAARAGVLGASLLPRLRTVLLLAGPLAVVVGVGYFYVTGGRYVSTDDARVEAPRTWISTDIPGRVAEIDIRDNQFVQRGQTLFRLGPRQY